MERIEIELPEELVTQVAEAAEKKGVTVDELIEWAIWQKLRGEDVG